MPESVWTGEGTVPADRGARRLSGLTLFYRPVGDRTVVSVRGDLDLDGDDRLRDALQAALAGSDDSGVALEPGGVESCGCSAVNIVLNIAPWPTESAARTVEQDGPQEDDLHVEVAQLRRAMRSRGVIDIARGVLVAAFGLSPEKAWDALVTVSQHTNTKLHEVARQLVDSTHGTAPLPDALQEELSAVVARFTA
ncbi:ANTAR domain-containing protein [Streptomyces sp. SID8379]|uniref:ANTAR domain-containing protein n=1 Tax=unclassified Streptomyces TaxID=2593676 RepID=UPI00035F09F6|nr:MULTISPECIES: ANTAR domain-containing protein [unclassified Streptomyces]MYW63154.1 ANTAR domain-containing protein [Streptomyces sp. SID8379]